LAPHRCYLKDVQRIYSEGINMRALCHVTGGGLIENPKRVLADNLNIIWKDFEMTDMFKKIQEISGVDKQEMWRVFNCGIGMLVFVRTEEKDKLLSLFSDSDPGYAFEVGIIGASENSKKNTEIVCEVAE
jgi:phosphoribosylformylglycinamidine cyclo-ligase